MHNTCKPLLESDFPLLSKLQESQKVTLRIPLPQTYLEVSQGRLRNAYNAVIDEITQVKTGLCDQAVRTSEACVTLYQFQLAVALVVYKLGVGKPLKSDIPKQLK